MIILKYWPATELLHSEVQPAVRESVDMVIKGGGGTNYHPADVHGNVYTRIVFKNTHTGCAVSLRSILYFDALATKVVNTL